MPPVTLSSAQDLTSGALVSGVKVVTSYPGLPSSETVEVLATLAERDALHVEWSSNMPRRLGELDLLRFHGHRVLLR